MGVSIEELKKLCDYIDGEYVSKKGNDYIDALSSLFSLDNQNDKPFTIEDIKKQPVLKDFKFPGVEEYKYICKLHAEPMRINREGKRKNEKIKETDFVDENAKSIFKDKLGVSYLITCEIEGKEYVIKIGSSRTSFKKRLGSYNCGVANNWRTASTTNIKILQSMVTTRLDFKLYLYDCSDEPYTINWHGIQSVLFASPKALAVEDIMVKQFIKEFGEKPLANIQANATEIDDEE